MYPYPTVAASNPRSAYSRPETVSAMHPSPKSASRREFGTLRPRKGTLKVAVVNYCVAKRSLFSIIDSLSKAFAWFASFLSTVTTTLNQFK